jgi:rhamnosyltransferase
MQQDVVAVVPTFRPDSALVPLVEELARSCSVVVADDGSPCTFDELLRTVQSIPHVSVIRFASNAGIARSLNTGLQYANEHHASWILTVDQDSVLGPNYVNDAVRIASAGIAANLQIGALGAGIVQDRSGPIRYPTSDIGIPHLSCLATQEVIQSGTLWNVPQLNAIGGFRTDLGMDAIDAAACLDLRSRDQHILISPELELHHHLGDAQQIQILGRSVIKTGHSRERRHSMVRNRLRLFPKEFQQSPAHALRTVRRAVVNQVISSFPHSRQ